MNQNETRTLWLSIGAALLAVFMLYSYTQEKSAELTRKFGQEDNVVVAKKDIGEMTTIDESMLEIVKKPKEFIQPTALTAIEGAVGLVSLVPLKAGEQIMENKIVKPGPLTGLSLQVSPTKRAVAIPVDEIRGVAKLLRPGDRIDLVAALDVGTGLNTRKEVKTLMQNVIVLATGLQIVNEIPALYEKQGKEDYVRNLRGDVAFASVTVEASPKEAQELIYILATSPGSLYMTLRHPSDHATISQAPATVDSVLGKVDVPTMMEQVRQPAAAPIVAPPPKAPKKKGPFINL